MTDARVYPLVIIGGIAGLLLLYIMATMHRSAKNVGHKFYHFVFLNTCFKTGGHAKKDKERAQPIPSPGEFHAVWLQFQLHRNVYEAREDERCQSALEKLKAFNKKHNLSGSSTLSEKQSKGAMRAGRRRSLVGKMGKQGTARSRHGRGGGSTGTGPSRSDVMSTTSYAVSDLSSVSH